MTRRAAPIPIVAESATSAAARAAGAGRHARPPRRQRLPRRGPTIATAFDPRHNNMGLLRLAFAALVIACHGWVLGGFGRVRTGSDPGSLAVDGFFVISGFLVTGSRMRLTTARFLWHRVLRIFPAYLVCLVITAWVIAPIAWVHDGGSLGGYARAHPHGPFAYVLDNLPLHQAFFDIAGTPADVPSTSPTGSGSTTWNGSLWTLVWEFSCYLGVAALGAVGILRHRRRLVAALATLAWLALAARTLAPSLAAPLAAGETVQIALRVGPMFLYGAVGYLYADRIRLSTPVAAACAVVVVGGDLLMAEPHLVIGPPLAYLCMWLAIRLPFQKAGSKRDLSYGLYIYACPIQQLAAVFGVHRHGLIAYFATFLPVVVLIATGSWYLVERPALRMKNWTAGRPAPAPIPAATPTPAVEAAGG